jgi:hypothetical protein
MVDWILMARLFARNRKVGAVARKELPWSIRFTGRLLAVQSIGFLAIALLTAPEPPLAMHNFAELYTPGLYVVLAFLSASAGLGILRLRASSWNLAMVLEGASLAYGLWLYFSDRPFFLYLQVLLSIVIVFNLNQPTLRRSFPTEIIEGPTEIHERPEA